MLKGAVARHYAQAVFELATEQGTIDRWHDDLKVVAEYLGNRRLAFVLKEPNIPAKRKELIVRDLLNGKVQREALNLAQLLTERGLADHRRSAADHRQAHPPARAGGPIDSWWRDCPCWGYADRW